MKRAVQPELLDQLPAGDPAAQHSRRDLRRLNALLRGAQLAACALRDNEQASPMEVADLGAGDGTFAWHLARQLPEVTQATIWLVDKEPAVSGATLEHLKASGWQARVVKADVFEWLSQEPARAFSAIIANLFLHHLPEPRLRDLFLQCARRSVLFFALDPARTRRALLASRLTGFIGCNHITRHDAVLSVRAGFRDRELSAFWPDPGAWALEERRAGLFSHIFVARRLCKT